MIPFFLSFLYFSFFLFNSIYLYAYPNFIGHGYSSCMICHFNPAGNGPLTDYGRAVSATAVSAKDLYSASMTDEKLAEMSGFFLNQPSANTGIRPSFKIRYVNYKQNYGDDSQKNESILMQATSQLVWNGGSRKQWIMSGDFGYAPDPRAQGSKKEDNYRSREHYIGYRFSQSFGLYAGLMDKTFGIKVPEHAAFSRIMTTNTMNDQVHGLVFHGVSKRFEFFLNPYLGNFAQSSDLRQKGMATTVEYLASEKMRLGVSALNSKSDYLKRQSYAVHTRIGFEEGNSLLGEYGYVTKSPLNSSTIKSYYGLAQGSLNLRRGLNFMQTFEYLRADTLTKDYIIRFGPSIQYFPAQRIEARIDLLNSRSFQKDAVSVDRLFIVGQIHLWF